MTMFMFYHNTLLLYSGGCIFGINERVRNISLSEVNKSKYLNGQCLILKQHL